MIFSKILLDWYETNKRDLPWRSSNNPYHIWLSEIILQQTRVEQGMKYYLDFISTYPSINLLANASEEEVLKRWQKLGYYSRARNLHKTAKYIATQLNGFFPTTYKDLLALKGVGPYSAAAIGSIAFNIPRAVVDGNVYRVLSRIYGIDSPIDQPTGKKYFQELAQSLLDKSNPGEFNQALMEFGALHCTVKNPNCEECVFKINCQAYQNQKISQLPVKSKKVSKRYRYFQYLNIEFNGYAYLKKRTASDIWQNLYDFPLIENERKQSPEEIISSEDWNNIFGGTTPEVHEVSTPVKHVLTHQYIEARFWKIKLNEMLSTDLQEYIKVPIENIKSYPVPKLLENYLIGKK